MNKEQQELLDEAYENYSKEYEKDNSIGMCLLVKRLDGKSTYKKPDREMFIDLCKYDKTFSEKWGLSIQERELTPKERIELAGGRIQDKYPALVEMSLRVCDERDIPTKLITITYNDKTIESYE
jgi:hypothetical protein